MTYNASSRKDIRRAEKDAKLRENNRIAYLRAAMSTIEGRIWFHDLLTACHLFADPFTGNALHEAYSKGERNIGLRLFADIVANCPDHYIQMMREAQIKESLNDRHDLNDDDGLSGDADGNTYDDSADDPSEFSGSTH